MGVDKHLVLPWKDIIQVHWHHLVKTWSQPHPVIPPFLHCLLNQSMRLAWGQSLQASYTLRFRTIRKFLRCLRQPRPHAVTRYGVEPSTKTKKWSTWRCMKSFQVVLHILQASGSPMALFSGASDPFGSCPHLSNSNTSKRCIES